MEQLTKDDLQRIAALLKIEAGIEIKVMPSPLMKKGVAILMMSSDDMEVFKDIFKPIEAKPLNYLLNKSVF